eukprot:1158710-Pelagomonas_calceolata.AAC.2
MDDGERCNALIKLLLSAWVHVARTGHAHIKDFVNFRGTCVVFTSFKSWMYLAESLALPRTSQTVDAPQGVLMGAHVLLQQYSAWEKGCSQAEHS